MSLTCPSIFKGTIIKLFLLVIFVLVNIILYTQSRYINTEAAVPSLSINRSVVLTSSSNNNMVAHIASLPHHISLSTSSANGTRHWTMSSEEKPFLREKIINGHNFQYLIKPNVTCSNREIELVICVVVSQGNQIGRSVIRDTWGTYAYDVKNKAVMVFFIGSKDEVHDKKPGSPYNFKILEEASIYGDILQEDYVDSYQNLSLKSVSILKWVSTFCSNAQFVLKVDDDMYVNIPFLVKILRNHVSDKQIPSAFVMGAMQVNAHPIRNPNSKWYTPELLFNEETYPVYVSGTAYVMTSEAASLLYEASLRVPRFWLEDIYITGLCSRKARVKVYDSSYFSYGKPTVSGCSFRAHFSGHRYSHEEILKIHKELYDSSLSCVNV